MKTKKRLLSVLLSLALMLGLMPGMSLTAYAESVQTYKIVFTSTGNPPQRTWKEDTTLPQTIGGSEMRSYMFYGAGCDHIVLKSGTNVSIDGTNITINGEGSASVWVYKTPTAYAKFGIEVTKNITATATGYTGSYDPSDTTGHGISVSVSVPNSGYTIKYGTSNGTYNLTESPKFTTAGNHTVYYQITADGYNTKTGSVVIKIDKVAPTANPPIGLTATYGQTLADVTLTNPEGNTPGTWAWANSNASVGDVGSHTFQANFTPTDSTNYNTASADVTVSVSKSDPTANPPIGLTATYGQTLADVTLTNPEGNTPGTWAWLDNTQSVGNVVSPAATFKANFTPTDTTNYNAVENVDVTVNVNKADAVAATVTANNRTYDGTEKPLVTVTGTASGGEMQYALGTDDKTAPTEGWGTEIPSKTSAGTYYVWYKVKGDENHNDSKAACVKVTIAAKPHEHTWGKWKVTKKATCAAKGEKKRTCSECKQEETAEIAIDPNNHTGKTEVKGAKKATTSKEGYTGDTYCKDCGKKIESGKAIPKLEKPEKVTATKNFRTLRLVAIRGKKAVTLKWRQHKKADGYLIYGCECGDDNEMKLLKTITKAKTTSWTQKKLKKGEYYKYRVVAYKKVKGKQKTVNVSMPVHTVTHDGKTTAVKSVKVNKTEVTLKKGKTFKIRASETKENRHKKIAHHREICYESSDESIVKVNAKGKVKGVKKGEAVIFVYAETGHYKTVKVTVK